jgi:hypothetical protein
MRRFGDFTSFCAALRPSCARLLTFLCITVLAAAAAAQTAPGVTLGTDRVTASGVTSGGQVLFFGVGVETGAFESITRRWSTVVTDSDHDGVAELVLNQPMPWKMAWAVVDLQSGQYAVKSPAGFPLLKPARAKTFRLKPGGTVQQLVSPGPHVDAIYVAGGSASLLQTSDGWSLDRDGTANGTCVIEAHDFTPLISGGSAPADFASGGVLVVVDHYDLSVFAVRITAEMLGGGQ